ncbi:heme-dependent oxidative N-demethylase family protein [Oricola nitratireducens]|jgi:hypothetical protein|uniref:heme-dependent oxidative N-demethylase family protein n=1 Tax=Oricola nitratireducens TaxID=2775868 RepID=UPI001865B59A|nr:DUF3445 domain-containing protein [Oricola nitratireducens]
MTAIPRALSIGLSPLADPARWLEPDDRLAAQLGEKERLIATYPKQVFMAEPDTLDAQREIDALLRAHLVAAFPQTYRAGGDAVIVAGRRVERTSGDDRVLQNTARLVADDLVIMRKRADGWTLAAASLCFPTFWNLAEKFARPITAIHAPVPGFSEGTRNAVLVERIFDKLQVGQQVQRSNWSVHNDGELHHIEPHGIPINCSDAATMARLFLRREYQTLTKLPASGDILFTIRVHTDPLEDIESVPGRCAALADRLMELDAEGLAYKGLTAGRDRLVGYLRHAAEVA